MKKLLRSAAIVLIVFLIARPVNAGWLASGPLVQVYGTTERASVSATQQQANDISAYPSISSDGRYVVFQSEADNLVSGDTNQSTDVFLRDLVSGATQCLSVAAGGDTPANNDSFSPSLAGYDPYVAFASYAMNLVGGPQGYFSKIYVRNFATGVTEHISVSSDGGLPNQSSDNPSISYDGHFIAFMSYASNLVESDTNNVTDVFLRDRVAGTTILISKAGDGTIGNGDSSLPSISFQGKHVVFASKASNLTPGDSNGKSDVFVYNRVPGAIERVSVGDDESQGNGDSTYAAISSDGRYVAFQSFASNLVSGDTNNTADIFVRDRLLGTTVRISVASNGAQSNSVCYQPVITPNGRYVAFFCFASNLVDGDTNGVNDVFVHDGETGVTARVSLANFGLQSNGFSNAAVLSSDGRFIAFESMAANLVVGDTNNKQDIFVRDRQGGPLWGIFLPLILSP